MQYGGIQLTIPSGNWYHLIPCPQNIHLDTRIKFIMSIDDSKCIFQGAAILKSNMADIKREFQVAQYLKMFATY